MKTPEGQAVYVLCRHFGYTPSSIGQMTQGQLDFLIAGWNEEQKQIEKAHKEAARKSKHK